MSKYEVFLGGSCNPTTWRIDLAIPELENMNISYYNPQQVGEWRPELLEVEYQAKENATVMFFVIDNQTRGVSALIEVAHLAGNRRKLILVIQSYTQKNQIICNEQISQKEYEDLKAGQNVLQNLVESQNIPVFDDIKVALKTTEKILRENLTVQDLQLHTIEKREEEKPTPQEIFEKLDVTNTGIISVKEACLALGVLNRNNISLEDMNKLSKKLGNNLNGNQSEDVKIDYESLLFLLKEYEREKEVGLTESDFSAGVNHHCYYDVYLGGTIENTQWRESIAVPMLNQENLSYFIPKIKEGKEQFTNVEAAAMDNSRVLLFVITGTARSISAMAIAGHYIGRGANVVLCIQYLPEEAKIDDETLSGRAVKDYNRGRMYLTDIAKRNGISVFDEIPEAVDYVMKKCLNR
ncbi:hypothetical protein Phum_PHUM105690 [Pediculus humanus corporis]|uniref:EF-hand domain-containing protein n=1 Tax=Pediculus humanus subsp. corporis TaxID=121224 RepID=E0VD46_PEDHC|nr:uncharacterized protein Phum_PHUM105690 [Pediculus humanus corporis]EEB11302.1 hypothetical protein Phum_PHUM105690 [Pediculus humanus corporis]